MIPWTGRSNSSNAKAVTNEYFSVKEVAEKTCALLGGSVEMVDWPRDRKATEVGDMIFSNKKIKKMISWFPKIGLEKGLIKTGDYFYNCLQKYI